jgi:pyrimidine-nucleoside phosphorylase
VTPVKLLLDMKREGGELAEADIRALVASYTAGDVPDYQMAAFAMAVCCKGMSAQEMYALTDAMRLSGECLDWSECSLPTADKHSTGGIGDKLSFLIQPIVAACGVAVPSLAGRGLGLTGGTIDKLESIPGLSIAIEEKDFIKQVNEMHFSIIGQTGSLVPADKKMYALRDVTGTVNSIPLIASSIMSKKLAAGADGILLDVKYGDGAFMKTIEDARVLAKTMIEIGKHLGKDTRATISNMNQPLGNAIGNALEVKEAIATLNGEGPEDFTSLCFEEGETMLMMAHVASSREEAKEMLHKVIEDKSALNVFKKMVEAQGGDGSYITDPSKFKEVKEVIEVTSSKEGYIEDLEALTLGLVSMKLGGGRATVDDVIDHSVGLVLHKKIGDYVKQGESLLSVYTNTGLSDELREEIISAYHLTSQTVKKPNIVEETL